VNTNTPDIVLHHYPLSPFAEKVRTVLGFKQLAWKSVIIPAVMPKPDVVALTGGYRKTPILQIGLDIYCDTALICDVLEHLKPTPALYPAAQKGLARVLAQWADTTLFWAAMAYSFQPKGAAAVFADAAPEAAQAFGADRAAMRGGMARQFAGDAAAAYKSYLRRLADMLESQDYLLGEAPCIADFAAYHPLWFTRTQVPVLADILSSTPAVLAWMDRIQAFGHGNIEKLNSGDAVALCAASSEGFALHDSRFQDEHSIPLGSKVTIAAESFGTETTQGDLIGASRTRYTLRRQDARAGTVLVHFPRIGYVLKKVTA
jgi:glutathione S-transferase